MIRNSMEPMARLLRLVRGGRAVVFVWLILLSAPAQTQVVYAPDAFVSEAFSGEPPKPQALWLTADVQEGIKEILGHKKQALRLRYWRKGDRTAWILEEIGKEEPITAGFVIENGKIEAVHVLIYRESRGWEIRYPYFREQFVSAELEEDYELSRNIDGISGATLSVRAMQKMARLALYLHSVVMEQGQ